MLEGGRSVDHVAGYVHRVESVLNRSSERFIDELGQTKAHARILIGLLADENDFPTDAPASGEHASGFQSSQFRELEFVLGYKRADLLRYQQQGTPAYDRLARRLHPRRTRRQRRGTRWHLNRRSAFASFAHPPRPLR